MMLLLSRQNAVFASDQLDLKSSLEGDGRVVAKGFCNVCTDSSRQILTINTSVTKLRKMKQKNCCHPDKKLIGISNVEPHFAERWEEQC